LFILHTSVGIADTRVLTKLLSPRKHYKHRAQANLHQD
jgi:hypothetical protein